MTSAELERLGPIRVHSVLNHDALERIVQSQNSFGGDAMARIFPSRFDGRSVLMVAVRYTNIRIDVGPLDARIARRIGGMVRWRAFFNRVTTCHAALDSDPGSEGYLDVWLNPPENAVPDSAREPRRRAR